MVLRLITKKSGKVSVYARGAKNSKRRFGSLDLLDCGTFHYQTQRSGIPNLVSFQPSSSFPGIRTTYNQLVVASLICEIFDYLIPEHLPDDGGSFEILKTSLSNVANTQELAALLKTLFKATYKILEFSGLVSEELTASSHNLQRLLLIIEQHCERKLESKETVTALIKELKLA